MINTTPNFNLIKCSVDVVDYYNEGEENENDLINLNYVFRIKKHNDIFTGRKYDAPAIWFYHNIVSPSERSHDIWWWYYPNTKEGFEMRNNDYERICLLCK